MTPTGDVLVVGQGPAGHRLAERLRHHGHRGRVTVLSAGTRPTHQRALLPAALAGGLPATALALAAAPVGVEVHRGVRAVGVDRARRVVRDHTGAEHRYDHLVLATGARSRAVGPEGGVHTLAGVDDLRALRARRGDAVVVGGGRHGVEVALALARRPGGARVTLVDPHPHPLAGHLDATAGAVVTAALERHGVGVRCGRRAVAHRDGALVLHGTDGESEEVLAAPTVVLATGRAPATELAVAAGLPVGAGVRVDDRLATVDPRVHALGDGADVPGAARGDLAAAHAQAEVLALRLTGTDARHRGGAGVTRLRVGDLDVVALAAPDDGAGAVVDGRVVDETVVLGDPAGIRHARLELAGGRVVRAVAVGFPAAAGPLVQHRLRDRPLPTARLAMLLGTPPATGGTADPVELPDDAVVCVCNSVTRGALGAAHRDGADTVDAIARTTRATTGCGTCEATVCRLLEGLSEREVTA